MVQEQCSIRRTKMYRKITKIFSVDSTKIIVFFFFFWLPIFAQNPLAVDNSVLYDPKRWRQFRVSVVYNWIRFSCRVCVCGAADFSVRKSHSLMDWIIFRLFGICDVNSKSLWQHWINAITSGREYHGLFGNGKHRTGKRNQLILMIMQRQKILE